MSEKRPLTEPWVGPLTSVRDLTDEQRRARKLSSLQTIVDVVGDEKIPEVVAYAREKGLVGFDTEIAAREEFANRPDAWKSPHTARIILTQIGDLDRQYIIWWETLSEESKAVIATLWNESTPKKAVVNGKYDAKMFLVDRGLDARVTGAYDCQLIEQILGCGLLGVDIGHTQKLTGMGAMSERWLGLTLLKDEEVRTGWEFMTPGKWWPTEAEHAEALRNGMETRSYEDVKREGEIKRYYAADDVVVPIHLLQRQLPWIRELGLVETLKIEMEFLPVLAEMEVRGLQMDWPAWVQLIKEAEEKYTKAQRDLDALFEVKVTYRVDMEGHVEISRDKNYSSNEELVDLINAWMWKHRGIDVIGKNQHLRDALERGGMNASRLDKLFASFMVPNPDKPGAQMKVGYPHMTDYLTGASWQEGDKRRSVPDLWKRYKDKLSEHAFLLTTTDAKMLKLLRILHETPNDVIDDLDYIPTKYGLPPELVNPILDYRKYGKLLGTYGYNFKDFINPVTERIHPDTTQCASDTGRLSSSEPNFQNLPGKAAYRAAVCRARPGYKIVGADFSQIEPRIIGQLSNCRTYMKVFWSDRPGTEGFKFWCGDDVTEVLDLYGTVGAGMGVLPPEGAKKSVAKLPESKPGRQKSKIAALGLGYGTGPPKFHLTYIRDTNEYARRSETDGIFNSFWSAAQEVKQTLDHFSDLADPDESKRRVYHPFAGDTITWSETLGGRKRYFTSDSFQWWTQGRNHPIQGAGADILKRTCVEFGQWMWKEGIDGFLILTAHDELLAEVRADQAERVKQAMEFFMAKVGQRYCPNVPITAEGYVDDVWVKD